VLQRVARRAAAAAVAPEAAAGAAAVATGGLEDLLLLLLLDATTRVEVTLVLVRVHKVWWSDGGEAHARQAVW